MRWSGMLLLAAILATGCARSPMLTLHTLVPPAAEHSAAAAAPAGERHRLHIVILGATVPQSVDRPQFMVSGSGDTVTLVDDQRWVEPLKRAIPSTLAHYLAAELGDAVVWSSSSAAPSTPHARITLAVERWVSVPGRSATVEVLWTIRSANREHSGRSRVESSIQGAGYGELVSAHRQNLRMVARELAAGVRSVLPESESRDAAARR